MQETVVYLKKITQPEGEKKELERELSQCGWELFRMGMQEQYGLDGEKITIERNAHGKPYLPGHPQICFNISHSGEYAACALLPFRSAWICSSTAALPGSAWQNGIFPPKTRNALPQRRMLKRCFPDLDRGGELRQVEGNRSFGFSWNGKERGLLHAFQSGERI